MKNLFRIVFVLLLVSCSDSNNEIPEQINPNLFTGIYYYVNAQYCEDDYIEFNENKYSQVSFLIEANLNEIICSDVEQFSYDNSFTKVNDSILKVDNDYYLKLIDQGNGVFRLARSYQGLVLQDIINVRENYNPYNVQFKYLKRTK
ncbi:hypothetical protein [uncultured Polaribacter sp.]|uniref:hypothetical protein n=1 Tax=uncultured Polaribacter sp. TaxID=174711 RepID=UPI00261266B0|nr:hypothetical protein [uncultured Polaribacter sp.]